VTSDSSSTGKSSDPPTLARLRKAFEDYMEARGLRSTEQRRAIVDAFFESTEHMSLDDLLERVRSSDPRVGYATVYRTMKLLTESGVAHEHKFGDGFTRYELGDEHTHHDHLICLHCGSITEFEEPLIEQLQDRIAQRYGFEVREHKHELYGICKECQGARPARES
jgi:Fur family ferric uptake transcriptional regulator